MRKLASAAAALALAACAAGAPERSARVTPLDFLPVLAGDYFAIQSHETGHKYHIYIRTPEGYAEDPVRRYPVVYVLDGDSLFPVLAASQRFLHHDDDLPEALIVGISYGSFDAPMNRRRHDFTDGADAFGNFLERELIPATERRVRADPDRRILFGQSRGGGFVLHSAFTRPDLFWARVASNPTLDLLPALSQPPAPATRSGLRLLVASGSLDSPQYRRPLLAWFERWASKPALPWSLRTETIEGGTHAADAPNVYRLAMRWLLLPPKDDDQVPI